MPTVDVADPSASLYEARLGRAVLRGGPGASVSALRLLELWEPRSLCTALSALAAMGQISPATFDSVAEAWEMYRHTRDLAWD